ncbi:hypothetical protein MBLNU230_g8078t1 [Neophaeotheca triangularis]
MHLTLNLLLLAAVLATANPLPSFADVEARWSQGESEAQIHAAHTYRDATPSWGHAHRSAAAFPAATDERSQQQQKNRRAAATTTSLSQNLRAEMRAFVNRVLQSHSEEGAEVAREKREEEVTAPVLKPRRGMRYAFSA